MIARFASPHIRSTFYIVTLCMLSACSSLPAWFSGRSVTVNTPAPLVDFAETKTLSVAWEYRITKAFDDTRHRHLVQATTTHGLYAVDPQGIVTALDANGAVRWRTDTARNTVVGVQADADIAIVGADDGTVTALDTESGTVLWQKSLESLIDAPIALTKTHIYARAANGLLYALDRTAGTVLWRFVFDPPLLSLHGASMPITTETTVVFASDDGVVYALDRHDGRLLWQRRIAFPKDGILESLHEGNILPDTTGGFFVTTYQNALSHLDENGALLWQQPISSYLGIATDAAHVYVIDDEGGIHAVDAENGDITWYSEQFVHRITAPPVLWNDYLVIADFEGYVHVLGANDGIQHARIRVGSAAIRFMTTQNDRLFVRSDNGTLFALVASEPTQ